jgi:hypothetical protein
MKGRILEGAAVLPPMEPAAGRQGTKPAGRPKGRRGARERWQLLNTFVDCTMRGLGRADVAVWLVLYRDSEGGTAQVGQGRIAARAGVCRRTVTLAIGRLKRAGLVEVIRRGGIGRGLSAYRIRAVSKPP